MYLPFTGTIMALCIVMEAPTASSLEIFGAEKAVDIIPGVICGMLLIAYTIFVPYFHRRSVRNDLGVKFYHLALGPLLWKEDLWLSFSAKSATVVRDGSEQPALLAWCIGREDEIFHSAREPSNEHNF